MLKEYAAFPLFGTVGVDSSYYGPPTEAVLRAMPKICLPAFPASARSGVKLPSTPSPRLRTRTRAGKLNPDFLNPELFVEEIYQPYRRYFARNTGPFVFEFQTIAKFTGLDAESFADRLDQFFSALPRDAEYAVEIRNEEFLTPMYFAVLRSMVWPTCSTPGPECRRSDISSTCPTR